MYNLDIISLSEKTVDVIPVHGNNYMTALRAALPLKVQLFFLRKYICLFPGFARINYEILVFKYFQS